MRLRTASTLLAMLSLAVLQSCGDGTPVFHEADNPSRLSDWNLLSIRSGRLEPNPETLRFQPLNTLFSDYAHKFRTLWVPPEEQIRLTDRQFDYPTGTVLTKTFYYPVDDTGQFLRTQDRGTSDSIDLAGHRLLETRLLVKREAGWEAFPYVWNEAQSEALLRVAGANIPAELSSQDGTDAFGYFVPNENQCAGCHVRTYPDGGLEPLGAVAHQLNHNLPGESQTVLRRMVEKGWLNRSPDIEEIPFWLDESRTLEERALAYLDINCGHCHNPEGPADTSALLLDGFDRMPREMGRCKPPVAAGGGAGDRQFGIVPGQPDESILLYRMQSTAPDEMMPELGRSLVHDEGLALIRGWIAGMAGTCR